MGFSAHLHVCWYIFPLVFSIASQFGLGIVRISNRTRDFAVTCTEGFVVIVFLVRIFGCRGCAGTFGV